MRRALRWLGWGVAGVTGTLLLLLGLVIGGTATPPGREAIERLVPAVTDGAVRIRGLSGWVFHQVRIAQVTLRNAGGTWLAIDGLALDWDPLRLLRGELRVSRLAVAHASVWHRPAIDGGGGGSLPVSIHVTGIRIDRLDLAVPVLGRAATLAGTGSLTLTDQRTEAQLYLRRLDGAGTYDLNGALDTAGVHATLHLSEPTGGLVAALAGLPAIGALDADATLAGPLDAIVTRLTVRAGDLRAIVGGTVDVPGATGTLTINAGAPAMQPRPDLSWQGVTVLAQVRGSLTQPKVQATLSAQGLAAGAALIRQVDATVTGDAGALTLDGALTGVRLPGAAPDVLAAAPVQVTATAQLDAPRRPVRFSLRHKLFTIAGQAETAGTPHLAAQVEVPDLAPLAVAAGLPTLAGATALSVQAAWRDGAARFGVTGTLGLTGGPGPTPALLGAGSHLDVQGTLRDGVVTLARFDVTNGVLTAGASGTVAPGALALRWQAALTDVAALQPTLHGALHATGTLDGAPDNLALAADLAGTLAAPGVAPGPVHARLTLTGLPNAAVGQVQADGTLLGAPLALDATAQPSGQGIAVTIRHAAWKSAQAEGTLQVTPPDPLPLGHLTFAMERLEDLQPLLGRPITGSISGRLDGNPDGAALTLTARQASLGGAGSVARAELMATVQAPTTQPVVDGRLVLQAVSAGGLTGDLLLTAAGPPAAMAVRATATLPKLRDAPARLTAAGTVNVLARQATLARMQASWQQTAPRLLAPARIGFADGITVNDLRLGLGKAVLAVNGRVSPRLDLTARLDALPVALAALVDPGLAVAGTLAGTARLTGTLAQPAGTLRLTGHSLRVANAAGQALPAAEAALTAVLDGTTARIDGQARAGASHLAVTGRLGTDGALDLRATGAADLTLTDPLLTPVGRRARGELTLDASLTGTAAAPRVVGQARLAHGTFRDFVQGIDLSDITAALQADGGRLRLTQFSAKAGPGTITADGQLDLTATGLPIAVHVTARDARLWASDRLTAALDADLALAGAVDGQLTATGHVLVRRADIRIPERLPPSIATLDVRVAGTPPPPPPPSPPDVRMDVTIDAPQQIFVHGRGVEAELGGEVRLTGSVGGLVPAGGFTLRRGSYSLAGQTLTFRSGQISFNGGSLTDPSLNLVASTTTADVTATLTISGTASNPRITLSSSPSLPQDEVLSYLLYGKRTASLGPLELAQIAATLASLSGVAPGIGNPLDQVRQALGLDRLSVGAGQQLEAGRYVARDVYVGARQSTSGTGTQAVVQVDLAKGLTLEATAGTTAPQTAIGAGGSADAASVGIRYQFAY